MLSSAGSSSDTCVGLQGGRKEREKEKVTKVSQPAMHRGMRESNILRAFLVMVVDVV